MRGNVRIYPLDQIYELSKLINLFLIQRDLGTIINPISADIILKADPFNKPGLLVLAISLLRFKDASNFLFCKKEIDDNVLIFQGKTQRYVSVDFSSVPKEIRKLIVRVNKNYEVLNYGRLSNNIRNYLDLYYPNLDYSFSSRCHIFRHLEASFRKSQKVSEILISKSLGHVDNRSQKSYLHDELINLFSN